MLKIKSNKVKDFYSKLKFPGCYSIEDLQFYDKEIKNPYLKIIDDHLENNTNILDVGCGAGYILNLFASRYQSQFTAVDFSDAINYSIEFSQKHNIKNINYKKIDFLNINLSCQYDIVICQGVLHHIPDIDNAIQNLKSITKKKLILSVYHPTGKLLKKYVNINYKNEMLRIDQEEVPYETSFTQKQVLTLFNNFKLVDSYPSNPCFEFISSPLKHSINGGLITYVLEKNAYHK